MAKTGVTKKRSRRIDDFWIYVIDLDPIVLEQKKKFVKANPGHRDGKPCVYVGSSTKTPRDRFLQHKAGEGNHSDYVLDFGLDVIEDQCAEYKAITRDEAEARERRKASRLRNQGYAVWQK